VLSTRAGNSGITFSSWFDDATRLLPDDLRVLLGFDGVMLKHGSENGSTGSPNLFPNSHSCSSRYPISHSAAPPFLGRKLTALVLLLALDRDTLSVLVLVQSMVDNLCLHGVWLVSMERRDVLRRHIWHPLPKGIGRLASGGGNVAEQSDGRVKWDRDTKSRNPGPGLDRDPQIQGRITETGSKGRGISEEEQEYSSLLERTGLVEYTSHLLRLRCGSKSDGNIVLIIAINRDKRRDVMLVLLFLGWGVFYFQGPFGFILPMSRGVWRGVLFHLLT
jgi:hypothetical protein